MGGRELLSLPATLMFDVIYSLALEDTKHAQENRASLDAKLASLAVGRKGNDGKPDRASWGRLPHQQAAMRAAQAAGS